MLKIIKYIPKYSKFYFSQKYVDTETYRSILNQIDQSEQITKQGDYTKEQWDQYKEYQQSLKNHFTNISDKEFLERSKKLLNKYQRNQEYNPNEKENISDNYKNYSKYEQSFVKLKQRELDLTEDGEKYRENMLNFINQLNDDLTEKTDLGIMLNHLSQQSPENLGLNDKDLISQLSPDIDLDFDARSEPMQASSSDDDDVRGQKSEQQASMQDNLDYLYEHQGRLSLDAKENIHKLYNEGWTVRDLSLRYGILPERVKAVIWLRKQFYDEYLPKMDIELLSLVIEKEQQYNEWFPYVDYGIDLEDLQKRQTGEGLQYWNKNEIFDGKKIKDIDTLEKLKVQKIPKKKKEFIVEGFVGKGNKGYYIQNQINHQGRGSMKVNSTFKKIIQNGSDHRNLSQKIIDKLVQGPRIASLGKGFK